MSAPLPNPHPGPAGDPDRPLVTATGASHLMTHAYLLVYPAILILLREEFGLSLQALGAIANLQYLASGAGALPAGWIADRIGAARALRLCMWGSAAALVLIALAPGPALLSGALTALGAFCSLHHPAGLALLSLRARRMGRALVLHGMIGNLGIALTPFAAAALAEGIGWRATCVVLALPGVWVGWLFSRLKLAEGPRREADPAPAAQAQAGAVDEIRWRPLLFLYLFVTLSGLVYSGTTTFLPARLAELADGGGVVRAGAITSLALLVGMIGQYVGGILWRRLPPVALLAGLVACASPCLAAVGSASLAAAAAGAAGFAFFHLAAQPVSNGALARWVPARRRSLGYGIYFTLSFGIGSFAAGAAGLIAQRRGLAAVFPCLAAASAAAAAVTAGMVERPSPQRQATP
jgi:MFS family permease